MCAIKPVCVCSLSLVILVELKGVCERESKQITGEHFSVVSTCFYLFTTKYRLGQQERRQKTGESTKCRKLVLVCVHVNIWNEKKTRAALGGVSWWERNKQAGNGLVCSRRGGSRVQNRNVWFCVVVSCEGESEESVPQVASFLNKEMKQTLQTS